MAKVLNLPARRHGQRLVHSSIQIVNELAAKGLSQQRQYLAAIMATKRVIEVEPNSKEMWCNIGSYFFHVQEYAQAEAALCRALSIEEKMPLAHINLALVYEVTGYFDKAREHFDRGIELDPTNERFVWSLSLMDLRLGNYKEGFEKYEKRIPVRKYKGKPCYPKFPAPYYNGEPLAGKSVYVFAEQGMGDTILFSRFFPWLHDQGVKIYFCCNPEMTNLLYEYKEIVEFVPQGVPIPTTDSTIPIGSLPHWSGITLETLPQDPGYIRRRVERYVKDVGIKLPVARGVTPFKVGICWRGNPEQERDEERRIPFEQIARVVENPFVWPYSFQVGAGVDDLNKSGMGTLIADLSPQLIEEGLVGCGAALLQMDLLITSCTMVAHLAGVLGIPCWTLLCFDAYWPWLYKRKDSPWHPQTRLFRQVVPQNWAWVMNDVMEALKDIAVDKRQLA